MNVRSLCLVVAMIAAPYAASAATLSVSGGVAGSLPSNFSAASASGASVGDDITIFKAPTGSLIGGGLTLDTEARIRVTFLGKSARASNSFSLGGSSLSNNDAAGSYFETIVSGGILDLSFTTLLNGVTRSITNGGTSDFGSLSMAFSETLNGDGSILAFFGDGRGDSDFDDMVVRIDAFDLLPVPLPASVGLLGLVLGGIGLFAARRRRPDV